jgi:hypothetical protein
MTVLAKKPIQVYLRQEQLDSLRALSEKQEVSLAELVRQSVDKFLAETPIEDDPLWDIINLGQSDVGDLALRHDYYLAEIEQEDNQYGA